MTRVTISVPGDLHRAIQAGRGRILLNDGIDVSYSAFISSLAHAGIFWMARENEFVQRVVSEKSERVRGLPTEVKLTPEQEDELYRKILDPIEDIEVEDATFYMDADVGILAKEMLPHILKKRKRKKKKKK